MTGKLVLVVGRGLYYSLREPLEWHECSHNMVVASSTGSDPRENKVEVTISFMTSPQKTQLLPRNPRFQIRQPYSVREGDI